MINQVVIDSGSKSHWTVWRQSYGKVELCTAYATHVCWSSHVLRTWHDPHLITCNRHANDNNNINNNWQNIHHSTRRSHFAKRNIVLWLEAKNQIITTTTTAIWSFIDRRYSFFTSPPVSHCLHTLGWGSVLFRSLLCWTFSFLLNMCILIWWVVAYICERLHKIIIMTTTTATATTTTKSNCTHQTLDAIHIE